MADDHPIVSEALKAMLEGSSDGLAVVTSSTMDELLVQLDQGPLPDLALIDYHMPGMGAPSVIGNLRDRFPALNIGVISGHEEPGVIKDVVRNGALGFVPKSMATEAMIHAIMTMAKGGAYLPRAAMMDEPEGKAEANAEATEPAAPTATSKPFDLTDREVDVLTELVQGLSNKQIAINLDIAEITVKLHLRHIYKKIGVTNRGGAILFALKNGFAAP